jgi:hypothetical protein
MPSSANHSMMSAEDIASILASASGLPCSAVSTSATASARSRIMTAARRMSLARSAAGTSRHAEAFLGGGKRLVEVGNAGMGDASDFRSRRRIVHGDGAAIASGFPLAGNH